METAPEFQSLRPQIAVIFVSHLDLGGTVAPSMAEKLCKNFAKATHDAWGVGHKDTQSGILIAASQHERCVSSQP